jgi:hypothetical protein
MPGPSGRGVDGEIVAAHAAVAPPGRGVTRQGGEGVHGERHGGGPQPGGAPERAPRAGLSGGRG